MTREANRDLERPENGRQLGERCLGGRDCSPTLRVSSEFLHRPERVVERAPISRQIYSPAPGFIEVTTRPCSFRATPSKLNAVLRVSQCLEGELSLDIVVNLAGLATLEEMQRLNKVLTTSTVVTVREAEAVTHTLTLQSSTTTAPPKFSCHTHDPPRTPGSF
jgi:hypothetical protein